MATRSVLITGTAGGVGQALVELIRGDDTFVIAAARSLSQISKYESAMVKTVAMDVADTASVAAAFLEVDRLLDGRKLDAVIHCAAIAPLATVEFTPPEAYGRVINVNTLGSLRILQGALPRLRGHRGRLILLSSLWGKVSGPLVGSYASSKHAIEAMADAARREIAGSGVHISVVNIGVVLTKMATGQGVELQEKIAGLSAAERSIYLGLYQAFPKLLEAGVKSAISAETCAAAIKVILDARNPKPRYLVGKDAKILVRLNRILPDSWMDAIFGKMVKR